MVIQGNPVISRFHWHNKFFHRNCKGTDFKASKKALYLIYGMTWKLCLREIKVKFKMKLREVSCFSSGERFLANSCPIQIKVASYQSTSFLQFSVRSKSSAMSSWWGRVMLHRAGTSSFLASFLTLVKVRVTHCVSFLLWNIVLLKRTNFSFFSLLLEK